MKSAGSKYVDLPADFVFYWIKLLVELYSFFCFIVENMRSILWKTFNVFAKNVEGFMLKGSMF